MSKDKEEKKEYPLTKEEKLAKAKAIMRTQNKMIGENVNITGADIELTTRTSLGITEIDALLGGGVPNGKIITAWGDKGSGKTTFALEYAAARQREGKVVYYIALEPLDAERAKMLGVNLEELLVGQFPVAEQSLDAILKLSRERTVDTIILDSIHSLSPEGEQKDKNGKDKSMSDDTMALLARKLSQFFRQAVHPLSFGKVDLILIAQSRTSLGFIAMEALTGGNALKFYSKLILHFRKGQGKNAPKDLVVDDNGDGENKPVGFECVIKIDKTQISGTKSELSEIRLPYYFESGFREPKEKGDATATLDKDEIKEIGKDGVVEYKKEEKKRGRPAKEKNDAPKTTND